MQTWLDWYVKHACAMTRTADPAVLGGGSDHEMFADMTADAYRLVMSKNREYEKH